jgi:predicted HAD superfamily Cof-like phosphohydrolase
MVFDLRMFHAKFGHPRPDAPSSLNKELYDFRIKFLQEELDEYKHAVETGDLEKQFDALLDLVYVAIGTADLQGFPWEEGWAEVQRSNMTKERAKTAAESKRGYVGDVIKPPGWRGPDIAGVLEEAARRAVKVDPSLLEPSPL